MTELRPDGVDFESWTDTLIRQALERGELGDVPSLARKPIPGIDQPYDEDW